MSGRSLEEVDTLTKDKKEKGRVSEAVYLVADVEPGDWFCNDCLAHFGRPVCDAEDETMLWLCPVCHSVVIS